MIKPDLAYYTGSRINVAQGIAKVQFKEADYFLRIKQQELFEQLTKYYFGVVPAKQVFTTRSDTERDLFKHLENARKLESQGQIAIVERLKAEANHTMTKVEKHKADRSFEIAQLAKGKIRCELGQRIINFKGAQNTHLIHLRLY